MRRFQIASPDPMSFCIKPAPIARPYNSCKHLFGLDRNIWRTFVAERPFVSNGIEGEHRVVEVSKIAAASVTRPPTRIEQPCIVPRRFAADVTFRPAHRSAVIDSAPSIDKCSILQDLHTIAHSACRRQLHVGFESSFDKFPTRRNRIQAALVTLT